MQGHSIQARLSRIIHYCAIERGITMDSCPYSRCDEDNRKQAEAWAEKLSAAGVTCDQLDDLLHDLYGSATASAINNSGLAGQIEAILDELGANGAIQAMGRQLRMDVSQLLD